MPIAYALLPRFLMLLITSPPSPFIRQRGYFFA